MESFLQSTVPTDAARRQQAEEYRQHITTELAQLQSQAQAPAHMWDWLLRLAAQGVYLCGQIYIRLLTLVVLPLVIFSLITGAASLGQTARLGQVALWAFSYYLVTSALAVLLGLVLVQTLRPGLGQMP
ncbi:MAG: cation:dicarboxylase symporter family transporter [Thermoguttaceae bacterium]|nr:cation:dicarboxylase symporter family transporter [Thermoguttaceae bacterium]